MEYTFRKTVRIVEQPIYRTQRIVCESDHSWIAFLPGINSTPENKTYPTIEIVGYKGRAVVVVSCVTKDLPHRPHPCNLVGNDGCKMGVCTLETSLENMRASFSNLYMQLPKIDNMEDSLRVREKIRVNPFLNGCPYGSELKKVDLNAVRLCFQVFLEGVKHSGKFTSPLKPIVSNIIYTTELEDATADRQNNWCCKFQNFIP